jgi:lipopolysaccharide export system protein LptA
MDENLSWKIVYIAAIFSLIVIGITYYFIAPRESPFFTEEKMERIAEFKNTRIFGRKEGQRLWKFFVAEGWTSKDQEITHLLKVSDGEIYQKDKPVVADLVAPRAQTYRHSEIVEAFGPPPLRAYLNLGRISDPENKDRREWARMTANHLKYVPAEKRSFLEGDVELHKKDSSIYAQKIIIDHDRKVADISGDIRLERKDGVLRADSLGYFSDEERLEADGNISLDIIEGKLETSIKCDHASFFTDLNREMTLAGSLEAKQGRKLALAREGIYSQNKNELALKGEVRAIFEKAGVLLREDTGRNLKSPEAQKILKEKTFLTSEKILFSTRSGDARAFGSVFVSQKGREAKSEQAVYNEKEETLTLFGNVRMKRGKDWINAKKVIVSIKDETFEAVGAVEAEFEL